MFSSHSIEAIKDHSCSYSYIDPSEEKQPKHPMRLRLREPEPFQDELNLFDGSSPKEDFLEGLDNWKNIHSEAMNQLVREEYNLSPNILKFEGVEDQNYLESDEISNDSNYPKIDNPFKTSSFGYNFRFEGDDFQKFGIFLLKIITIIWFINLNLRSLLKSLQENETKRREIII